MSNEDIIRDIRKRCRMAMNGIASSSMRSHGLDYKLNFGVSIMQVKDIASRYDSNANLAEMLWLDTTRELRILGTMLYPISELTDDVAMKWIREVSNQEIREQLCFNLLQNYENAINISLGCIEDLSTDVRSTGYWLLSRCLMAKKEVVNIDLSSIASIWGDITSENVTLRNSAKLLLQNLGKISEKMASQVLLKLEVFKNSTDLLKAEVYDSLAFDFDFYYDRFNN